MTTRSCGACQACCETLKIEQLNKPRYTKCENQCAIGCSKYNDRPEVCKGYECGWLNEDFTKLGILAEAERPDKSGLILETSLEGPLGPMLVVHEVWEGAADGYWGAKMLKRIGKHHLISVVWKDEPRRLIGPKYKLDQAAVEIQKQMHAKALGR